MINLDKNEFITAAEACEIWGLNESTLRWAFNRGSARFKEGEYKKSGKVWLVKYGAMCRLYGDPEKRECPE